MKRREESAREATHARRSPLQNRVDPWGRLCAVASRGAFTGNRGILHDASQRVVRPWASRAWITCVLHFGDVQRKVFAEGTWSELFFLDEATAFAAGHRPCGYCRRERYRAFKRAWLAANPDRVVGPNPRIGEIDRVLHEERVLRGGGKVTFEAPMNALPPGTMFALDGGACLVWEGRLHRWSFDGYARMSQPIVDRPVRVLTPASLVRVFAAGFVPQVHDSCRGGSAGSTIPAG